MGNFNQNIYTSYLAQQLTADNIGPEEQYSRLHDKQAPLSYIRGAEPITGCFATSSIFVRNYFMAAQGASGTVRDRHLHIIDFCALSILGVELPAVTKQVGRKL